MIMATIYTFIDALMATGNGDQVRAIVPNILVVVSSLSATERKI